MNSSSELPALLFGIRRGNFLRSPLRSVDGWAADLSSAVGTGGTATWQHPDDQPVELLRQQVPSGDQLQIPETTQNITGK